MVTARAGRLRAQGPFGHAILAGTVGAVSLPLMIGIWRSSRLSSGIGTLACLVMVVTSNSSGPAISLGFGLWAVLVWRIRRYTAVMRWSAVIIYLGLDLVMTAPAYCLMSRR